MANIPKEIIEATANAVMEGFIPKDKNEVEFSFHFTIPPANNFRATYKKDSEKNWQMLSCVKHNASAKWFLIETFHETFLYAFALMFAFMMVCLAFALNSRPSIYEN